MDHDIYLHRKQVFEILCLSRIPSSGNLLVGHIKSKDPKLGFAVKIVAHLCAKECDWSKRKAKSSGILTVPKEKTVPYKHWG